MLRSGLDSFVGVWVCFGGFFVNLICLGDVKVVCGEMIRD